MSRVEFGMLYQDVMRNLLAAEAREALASIHLVGIYGHCFFFIYLLFIFFTKTSNHPSTSILAGLGSYQIKSAHVHIPVSVLVLVNWWVIIHTFHSRYIEW